jgi:hypothetical protein
MVKYNATQATQEKTMFSPVQVAVGLAEARESLAQHMSDMAEIDGMIDHATVALIILNNFKDNEAQAIALVNHQHAMESLLGVAESRITISAAKEGLGDALKTAWNKIKEFISWLVQKIKDFFVWIGKKVGLSKDKSEKIKKIINDPNFDKKSCLEWGKTTVANKDSSQESLMSAFSFRYVYKVQDFKAILKDFEILSDVIMTRVLTHATDLESKSVSEIYNELMEASKEGHVATYEEMSENWKAEVEKAVSESNAKTKFIKLQFDGHHMTFAYLDVEPEISTYEKLGYTPDSVNALTKEITEALNGMSSGIEKVADAPDKLLKVVDKLKSTDNIKLVRAVNFLSKQMAMRLNACMHMNAAFARMSEQFNKIAIMYLEHGIKHGF